MSREQGFTLVELVLAMAVFSFMLLIIVVGFINIVHLRTQALAANVAQDSARVAMDRLVQAVRDSSGVYSINAGAAPGVADPTNYDVMCLQVSTGSPTEYFVASYPAGTPQQLFMRDTGCSTAAVNSSDVPLTSSQTFVSYFKVTELTDPSMTNWIPEESMELRVGSGNGTASGTGLAFNCNANNADRNFCSVTDITSGAVPR